MPEFTFRLSVPIPICRPSSPRSLFLRGIITFVSAASVVCALAAMSGVLTPSVNPMPAADANRVPVAGSEFTLEFDHVIAAIGQKPDIPAEFALELHGGLVK